jgi:hypothetical protein
MEGEYGVFVDGINSYAPHATDLDNQIRNAEGFHNTIQCPCSEIYLESLAWDTDFEQAGVGSPPAGEDEMYADLYEMAFFTGHGNSYFFSFGNREHDDGRAFPDNMRLGDLCCKWLVLDSCLGLKYNKGETNNVFTAWRKVFRGLHYILGFDTTCSDSPDRGSRFAEYLNAGWKIRTAWFQACMETEDQGGMSAYLRAGTTEDNSTYYDHWIGQGSVGSDPKPPVKLYYARHST